jgi:hypothetical protein
MLAEVIFTMDVMNAVDVAGLAGSQANQELQLAIQVNVTKKAMDVQKEMAAQLFQSMGLGQNLNVQG